MLMSIEIREKEILSLPPNTWLDYCLVRETQDIVVHLAHLTAKSLFG